MGLNGKNDTHLGSSSVGSGAVSRLEVLEGPSGRACVQRPSGLAIVAKSLLPGAQLAEVVQKRGRRAGKFTIGDDASDSAPNCRRARLRNRRSRRWSWRGRLRRLKFRQSSSRFAIGDVVVRTNAAIDGEQLSRVIRAVRASR